MKDKKKFGGCSLTSKNRSCKKFGWSYDKETRRIWRIEAKRMAHKVLMHLPISREEIQKAWSNPYMNLSELGVPYVWDGVGYYERWVEQVYKKLNNVHDLCKSNSSGAYYTNISILCYGGCTPLWYYIPYEQESNLRQTVYSILLLGTSGLMIMF